MTAATLNTHIVDLLNAEPLTALEIAIVLRADSAQVRGALEDLMSAAAIGRRWRDLEDDERGWGTKAAFRGVSDHRLQVGYIAR
jgi:hypothetical protein